MRIFVVVLIVLFSASAAGAVPDIGTKPDNKKRGGYVTKVTSSLSAASARLSPEARASLSTQDTTGRRCRAADKWIQYEWFGRYLPAFRWHQVKAWCWRRGRVVAVSVGSYANKIQAGFYKAGTEGYGHYYSWHRYHGGHVSQRTGYFNWCPIKVCIHQYAPWVRIWAHGDGTQYAQSG